MGIDILGIDILGIDILGIVILAPTPKKNDLPKTISQLQRFLYLSLTH